MSNRIVTFILIRQVVYRSLDDVWRFARTGLQANWCYGTVPDMIPAVGEDGA